MFRRTTNLIVILALALGMFACQIGPASQPTPNPTSQVAAPTQAPVESQATQPADQPTDSGLPAPTQPPATLALNGNQITLATTGFTQDSGLLKQLLKDFTDRTGIPVNVVSRVNPNQVLETGFNGQADALLVHDPEAEVSFVEKGYGVERRLVMHNDFIIVGPDADPAGIRNAKNSTDAFRRIAYFQAPFVSRGDNSVVNRLEGFIWNRAKVAPKGDWYTETAQGMFETLVAASDKGAYTLTDRQAFLLKKAGGSLNLSVLLEGDPKLLNYYHVIVVSPDKFPNLNVTGARALSEYLVSPEAQKIIAEFNVERLGQPTFWADGDKTDAELGLPEADFE
jgi:tungstate transport system substrate-binding protein